MKLKLKPPVFLCATLIAAILLTIVRNGVGQTPSAAQVETLSKQRLAESYAETGRSQEAIALLKKFCEEEPKNTDASLTLATWQTWFGQNAEYEATRHRLIAQAEGTDQAGTAERAAKAVSLRPSDD